ncbi:MAG: hypothetical protein V1663_03275 [archaeon]
MEFSKDLRELNQDEFKRVYDYLKEKTNDFSFVSPQVLLENNQYMLIFRICLGMSQRSLAEFIGVTKDCCRHIESKRLRIISLNKVKRYSEKINELISNKKISFDNTLLHWENYNKFQKNQVFKPKLILRSFNELQVKDLKKYYKILLNKTNNFQNITPNLIMDVPQIIVLLRVAGCITCLKISKLKIVSQKSLNNYEKLKSTIKLQTANKFSKFFNELFVNNKPDYQKFVENFRILKGFYGCRDLNFLVEQGLNRMAKINPNQYEDEIAELLNKNNIKFEKHKILDGLKTKSNVDFYIKEKNIVMEVFSYNSKKRSDIKLKACFVDHRFQSLKLKEPCRKTIICIKIYGKPILHDYVKRYLTMDLINTDFLFLNNEIENLAKTIKENL